MATVFFFSLTRCRSVVSFTQVITNHNSRSVRGSTTSLYYAEDNNTNGGGGRLSKKAYNDDALFQFHMMTQRQKIRDYSAMDTYVNTESLWNLAWHDSFVRNGLADFVPPLTDGLSVLVVGNRFQGPDTVGEIEGTKDENQSSTLAEINEEAASGDDSSMETSLTQQSQDSSCSFLAAVFNNDNAFDKDERSSSSSSSTELEFTMYDCIMDKGVLADLCASADDDSSRNDYKNKKDMARLLYEATKRIREMGVYVANTAPMSFETKEYLSKLGEYLGLQWEFDLDGISDDNLSVSVARKFGSCPIIGWQSMARMIED
ncbi:hypothetical protein ACHAWT_002826 [Skeletonema menzelii]